MSEPHEMKNSNKNQSRNNYTIFENSIQNIPAFVIVCNAAGPLTEDFYEEDDILPDD